MESKHSEPTEAVHAHYDAVAEGYSDQYERAQMFTRPRYPANYFRLQLLLNAFINKGVKRVIEVGVGEGTPLATLAKAGIDVWGFDISENMVERSRATVRALGIPAERIFWGDVLDPVTYAHSLSEGQFDGLMAMGVMPHVENDDLAMGNMATLVRPGGSVFIEFRNKLFSLFTFNRLTYEFILDDLLAQVSPQLKDLMAAELRNHVRMDLPPVRSTTDAGDGPGYDAILSKFHNPLEIHSLFERHGFSNLRLLWYHYHPALPRLQGEAAELFRKEAIRLEHEPSGWRGMFLCSAFVVEAVKDGA